MSLLGPTVHRTVADSMDSDSSIIQGVDTEELEQFREFAEANPEAITLGLAARATYEGTCAHSLAKVDSYILGGERIARETREYTLPFGAWKEVLDASGWVKAEDRLEPIEVGLAAMAACINVGITLNAIAHGIAIRQLQTRVRCEYDPRVLFGLLDIHETDGVFEHLTAEVEIEADGLEKDRVDEWARRAPMYTLFSRPQDVDVTVTTPPEVPGT